MTVLSEINIIWFVVVVALIILFICIYPRASIVPIIGGLYSLSEDNVDSSFYGGAVVIDAKNITSTKLKIAAKKQSTIETFVDALVANSRFYLKSMDTHPTDLAIHALNSYKPILVSAADILEKKYPDMQPNGSELRAINREIIEKIKSGDYALKMHKYGDISKEQLTKNYIGELTKTIPSSNNELDTCKTDLRIAEDKRTKLDNDNEYLRKNNEKLRDEIRRGLTSYTTETLLRDCREENERLKRVKPADDREIREIREIANMLQNEVNRCENLKATYESQIRTLQKELGETQEALKDVLG